VAANVLFTGTGGAHTHLLRLTLAVSQVVTDSMSIVAPSRHESIPLAAFLGETFSQATAWPDVPNVSSLVDELHKDLNVLAHQVSETLVNDTDWTQLEARSCSGRRWYSVELL
jgi:hypothetical protein